MTVPILLIVFNRPDHTRQALTEIRKQKPQKLYISQDGPRNNHETDLVQVQAVRDVVAEMVDWPCELHTHYLESNLGCGRGPYEAISWFFRNVEKGIILEDDILPHPLFFSYMEDLLERYKEDERIGMVTAHNLYRQYSRYNSYYFTMEMAGTLGWGTWRRVWEKFDFNIPYNAEDFTEALRRYKLPPLLVEQQKQTYSQWMSGSRHDCWDYQFDYFLLMNHYLNARANSCLTSHEGDGPDATHTGYSNPGYKMDIITSRFNPITHPRYINVDCSVWWRVAKKEIHLFFKKYAS